jgi:hypothetical protein
VDFVGRCDGILISIWGRNATFTEDESGTFVDAIEQIGKQVADGLEDRLSDFGSQDQNREEKLHQQATDDDSHRKAASVGTERPSDANHYA